MQWSITIGGLVVAYASITSASADAPPIPIWWDRAAHPEVKCPADCARAMREHRLDDGEGNSVSLVFEMDDGTEREVHTCGAFLEASAAGSPCWTTYCISMGSHFTEHFLFYYSLPHLLPSRSSAFRPESWTDDAKHLVLGDDAFAGGRPLDQPDSTWLITDTEVRFNDSTVNEVAQIVARGDYNGDGWEDLVISSGWSVCSGSARGSRVRMVTKRESGRVVDISPWLDFEQLNAAEREHHRASIADSFGFPQRIPIELVGSVRSNDGVIPIKMIVQIENGFLTGNSWNDLASAPISIEGSLDQYGNWIMFGFSTALQPTMQFRMTAVLEGRRLMITGTWCENYSVFSSEKDFPVTLIGVLPDDKSRDTQPLPAPWTMATSEWRGGELHFGDPEPASMGLRRFVTARPMEIEPSAIFEWTIVDEKLALASESNRKNDCESAARRCIADPLRASLKSNDGQPPARSLVYAIVPGEMWMVMDNVGGIHTNVVTRLGESYRIGAVSTPDVSGESSVAVKTVDFDGNGSMDFWIGRYSAGCGVAGLCGHSSVVLTDVPRRRAAIHDLGYSADCELVDLNVDGIPELLMGHLTTSSSAAAQRPDEIRYQAIGFETMRPIDRTALLPRAR